MNIYIYIYIYLFSSVCYRPNEVRSKAGVSLPYLLYKKITYRKIGIVTLNRELRIMLTHDS